MWTCCFTQRALNTIDMPRMSHRLSTMMLANILLSLWGDLRNHVTVCTSLCRAEKVALPSQGQREHDIHYFGVGVELAQALGRAAHGGQVLLSESAWASIQDQLPGSSQVKISP